VWVVTVTSSPSGVSTVGGSKSSFFSAASTRAGDDSGFERSASTDSTAGDRVCAERRSTSSR